MIAHKKSKLVHSFFLAFLIIGSSTNSFGMDYLKSIFVPSLETVKRQALFCLGMATLSEIAPEKPKKADFLERIAQKTAFDTLNAVSRGSLEAISGTWQDTLYAKKDTGVEQELVIKIKEIAKTMDIADADQLKIKALSDVGAHRAAYKYHFYYICPTNKTIYIHKYFYGQPNQEQLIREALYHYKNATYSKVTAWNYVNTSLTVFATPLIMNYLTESLADTTVNSQESWTTYFAKKALYGLGYVAMHYMVQGLLDAPKNKYVEHVASYAGDSVKSGGRTKE
ncbi:MAG: hypothetical protein AB7R69_04630 [Candidatus Babeliales bacterium]